MTTTDSADVGTGKQGLAVERIFDAPRELVWRAWTEPEHFMRWYGPEGMTSHACEIDFRVGGRYLFGLRSPDGFEYWNAGVYSEIVPLERFVATMLLADEHGNVVSPAHYGMPEGAPSETRLTVVLEDLGDGRTKLTLEQAGWLDDSMAAGANAGWNQALDKLAADLAG
ncbi:MAG: SRPBCC domain-containing protein [Chloroflexi bacterium]|nr:SRPBCC domain-containing protein [Chloroflexota bacterium]MQC28180.1 SRPBCC domain-containing protein [Chloroflexota bacterium]